jgi:hypothetical protein
MQNTQHLLMIQPVAFNFNTETAVNNSFQVASTETDIAARAKKEFIYFVQKLRDHKIDVTVIEDTPEPHTPDSVFPNNWISFHEDGTIILYPMFAKNRRLERKPHIIEVIKQKFNVIQTIDLTISEEHNIFLEGTGSMVLDRKNKIAYACISPRTNIILFNQFCKLRNYTPISFTATDKINHLIYHTNVMMCVADEYAIICLESIIDKEEKQLLINSIQQTKKEIISITLQQMNCFAGNMLQVKNMEGKRFLIMSSQAYNSLTKEQINTIQSYNQIIHSNLETIETNGGGSARCMIAEIFLPLKN